MELGRSAPLVGSAGGDLVMEEKRDNGEKRELTLTEQITLHEEFLVIAKPSPEWLKEQANLLGYQPSVVEQVFWLTTLLQNIYSHPFLRGRLVLKGGTALNLFWLDMPRLSLDLDFNYIGSVEKEGMKRERPQVESALERIFDALGLRLQGKRCEYAGTTYNLRYKSALGGEGNLQAEVNWLMRICLLQPEEVEKEFWGRRVKALILAKEELMAGKMKAFLERGAGRDLFDLWLLAKGKVTVNENLWRKLTIAFFSTINEKELSEQRGIRLKDLRELSVEEAMRADVKNLQQQLKDVVPHGQMSSISEMLEAIKPWVEKVLPLSWGEKEKEYFDALLEQGAVKAESLFEDKELARRWESHPAIRWKAENVRKHRKLS